MELNKQSIDSEKQRVLERINNENSSLKKREEALMAEIKELKKEIEIYKDDAKVDKKITKILLGVIEGDEK